jgi:hypothetical protein
MTAVPPSPERRFILHAPSLVLFPSHPPDGLRIQTRFSLKTNSFVSSESLESQKVDLKTLLREMKDLIMEEQLQTSVEKKGIALQVVADK